MRRTKRRMRTRRTRRRSVAARNSVTLAEAVGFGGDGRWQRRSRVRESRGIIAAAATAAAAAAACNGDDAAELGIRILQPRRAPLPVPDVPMMAALASPASPASSLVRRRVTQTMISEDDEEKDETKTKGKEREDTPQTAALAGDDNTQ